MTYKAKSIYAKYPINHKGKKKLEHRWGSRAYGNYLGKKRNKFEKASIEMNDKLKESQATFALG